MIRSHPVNPSIQWGLAHQIILHSLAFLSTFCTSYPPHCHHNCLWVGTYEHTLTLTNPFLTLESKPRSFWGDQAWAFCCSFRIFYSWDNLFPYSSRGVKSFWKHFNLPDVHTALESFIWQLIACLFSFLNTVLNIAQALPNPAALEYFVRGKRSERKILSTMQCWKVWWEAGTLRCDNSVAMAMLLKAYSSIKNFKTRMLLHRFRFWTSWTWF